MNTTIHLISKMKEQKIINLSKKSVSAKIVSFLVRVYVIPLKTNSKEEKEFKVFSCSFFLSMIIWCIIPITSKLFDMSAVDEWPKISQTIGFREQASFGLDLSGQVMDLAFYLSSPASLGYLCWKCQLITESKLKMPSRMFEITMHLILNTAYMIIYYSRLGNSWFIIAIQVYRYLVWMIQSSSILFLANTFTSSFTFMCQNLKQIGNSTQLLLEYKILINAYQGFKTGIGPIILFHYIYSSLYLMQFAFGHISDGTSMLLYVLMMAYTLVLLWNVSSCCQQCYEDLQKTKETLRYVVFSQN